MASCVLSCLALSLFISFIDVGDCWWTYPTTTGSQTSTATPITTTDYTTAATTGTTPGPPVLSVWSSQNPAQPYSYVTLYCRRTGGYSVYLRWLRNGNTLTSWTSRRIGQDLQHRFYFYPYHTGWYTCQANYYPNSFLRRNFWLQASQTTTFAETTTDYTTAATSVTSLAPPVLSVWSSQNPAQPYSYVTLYCRASQNGRYSVNLRWLRNGNTLKSWTSIRIGQNLQYQFYFYPYHTGHYTCQANDYVNGIISRSFWLQASQTTTDYTTAATSVTSLAPLVLSVWPSQNPARPYSYVTVYCRASRNGGYSVNLRWLRNGNTLTSWTSRRIGQDLQHRFYFYPHLYGRYTCQANDYANGIVGKEFWLHAAGQTTVSTTEMTEGTTIGFRLPSINVYASGLAPRPGQWFTLYCSAYNGIPSRYNLYWTLNDTFTLASRYGAYGSFTLSYTIHGVRHHNTGLYTCRVENSAGNVSRTLDVEMYKKARNIYLDLDKQSEFVRLGTVATFTCNVTSGAHPLPSMALYYNGILHDVTNMTLVETFAVRIEMAHHNIPFRCVVRMPDRLYDWIYSNTVKFGVGYPPNVTVVATKNPAAEGDSIKITCVAINGKPDIYLYTWEIVRGNKTKKMVNWKQKDISLTKVTSPDTGLYQCEVSNGAGVNRGAIYIDVHYAPKNIILQNVKKEQVEFELGDVLSCAADGNPAVQIQWRNNIRGDVNYPPGPRLALTKEMLGYNSFRCEATNLVAGQRQSRYLDFNITVVPARTASPPDVPTFVYFTVTAILVVVLVAVVIVVIVCRRRRSATQGSPAPIQNLTRAQEDEKVVARMHLDSGRRPPSENHYEKLNLYEGVHTSSEQLQPTGGWNADTSTHDESNVYYNETQ